MPPVSRGFHRRRAVKAAAWRIAPGQFLTDDFPVLSAGPTPRTPFDEWSLAIDGAVDGTRRWSYVGSYNDGDPWRKPRYRGD